jgi:tRNA 2-selenouridine synthase
VRSPNYTATPWHQTYSEIIDVRSEDEFREDHIPGAINLPVLNNQERQQVGTLYKQVSAFTGRKIGAALVSQNIARYLRQHFASKDKDYAPLIYCWRGGQRSHSLALVLSQIGWQVTVLEGGYKTYRAHVRQQLDSLAAKFTYKILCGFTGTGKTQILRQLAIHGAQVLDLEQLAHHQGSVLGQLWDTQPQPQPTQKFFESLLVEKLQQFALSRPIWLESESNKIGRIHLPKTLWQQMKRSPCIEIQLPLKSRVELLLKAYPHFQQHPEQLKNKLRLLRYRYGWEQIKKWESLIDGREWEVLVSDLITYYYDPAYSRSLAKIWQSIEKTLTFSNLSALDRAYQALLID